MKNPLKSFFEKLVHKALETYSPVKGGGVLNTFPCSHLNDDGSRSVSCFCELFQDGRETHREPGAVPFSVSTRMGAETRFILRLR